MSNESLQKVYDAARTFVGDATHLDGLRDALEAHDAESGKKPARKPRTAPKAAESAKEGS